MRISDWSSDVCSSDLLSIRFGDFHYALANPASFYLFVLALCTIVLFILWRLCKGSYGRVLTAIEDNEQRARTLGYNTSLRLLTVFRSEEHTSELQSLMRISYAVFCLKKKKNQHN